MARNDGRIEPGQKLSTAISARAWNRAQEAADRVLGAGAGFSATAAPRNDSSQTIIHVYNGTTNDIPVGGIMSLSTPALGSLSGGTLDGTSTASSALKAMFASPTFTGILTLASGPFGVAVEPIPAGKVGRMAISGCVYFRLKKTNYLHKYASPIAGNWQQLQSGGCGPVRLLWDENILNNLATRLGENLVAFGVM